MFFSHQAILRFRLKNRQIDIAKQKYIEDRKDDPVEIEHVVESEKTMNFDITNISDILTDDQVCFISFFMNGPMDNADYNLNFRKITLANVPAIFITGNINL